MSNKETRNQPSSQDAEEKEIDLREYLGIIIDGWRWVALAGIVGLLVAAYMAWSNAPVYQASSLMRVEAHQNLAPQAMATAAGGGESFQAKSAVTAEGAILKSRSVLSDAVNAANLAVRVSPRYMPFVGEQIARLHEAFSSGHWTPPFAAQYAWGNESAEITRISLPANVKSASFVLEARGDDAFAILSRVGKTLATGVIGQATKVTLPGIGEISVFVRGIDAAAGTRFNVRSLSMPSAVASLQHRIEVTEEPKGSGLLSIALTADSPAAAEQQLDAAMSAYLERSVENQSQQAQQRLSFLEKQLPEIKEERDQAQAKLARYQSKTGTLDLSAQAQSVLERVSSIDEQIAKVELERQQLLQEYTARAPQVQAASEKKSALQRRRNELQQDLKKLPAAESEFLELKRNVTVANEMYAQLLNTSQGLQVTKAGITSVTHIIDGAYAPSGKIAPNRTIMAVAGLLLGAIAGLLGVLAWALLRQTLEDPDTVERDHGLSVYATVPYSTIEAGYRKGKRREKHLLAIDHPEDTAIESLRSFRTSLQFANMKPGERSIGITGPSPACGKSFVSSNLAALLSQSGHSVLLVDADMRKGVLYQTLGVLQQPGLSDVLTGHHAFDDAVQTYEHGESFDVITTGKRPPNPAELLLGSRLREFVDQACSSYDYVIFDMPPVLNVTDANIVAAHTASNFLTVRSDHSTGTEVDQSIKRFDRDGLKITGAIFNGLRLDRHRYGSGKYGYYSYQYR